MLWGKLTVRKFSTWNYLKRATQKNDNGALSCMVISKKAFLSARPLCAGRCCEKVKDKIVKISKNFRKG